MQQTYCPLSIALQYIHTTGEIVKYGDLVQCEIV